MTPHDERTPLPEGVTIERATMADAATFIAIHEEAARWLWDRGIHQWAPGTFQRAWIEAPIARGELYIARRHGTPVGTLLIRWADEYTWGPRPDDAGYIHGLRVRRAAAGLGIGRALLAWAESGIARAGRPYARLDCIANNPALHAYYERAGYTHVDDIEVADKYGTDRLARFEKRVGERATVAAALRITRAGPDDIALAVAMEDEAAAWMRARGIEPGSPPRPLAEIFADAVAHGHLYLARLDGAVAGKISLTTEDDLWRELPAAALYVHGLTVRRAYAGRQVGLGMLAWAARRARDAGKTYLRLDCDADNAALRAYYEQRAGVTHRGDVVLAHRIASRYERQV